MKKIKVTIFQMCLYWIVWGLFALGLTIYSYVHHWYYGFTTICGIWAIGYLTLMPLASYQDYKEMKASNEQKRR